MKLIKNILQNYSDFKWSSLKCNINNIIMGPYNFYKHEYMEGIKCSCMIRECLSNLNNSSITLTTLIAFILFKKM